MAAGLGSGVLALSVSYSTVAVPQFIDETDENIRMSLQESSWFGRSRIWLALYLNVFKVVVAAVSRNF